MQGAILLLKLDVFLLVLICFNELFLEVVIVLSKADVEFLQLLINLLYLLRIIRVRSHTASATAIRGEALFGLGESNLSDAFLSAVSRFGDIR